MNGLAVSGVTSQGSREYQEDAFGHWMSENGLIFAVVADGAGGHGGGEQAAKAVIESAALAWKTPPTSAEAGDFLERWMADAHAAVNASSKASRRSGRAVVVACIADAGKLTWVHAGDSRLIRFVDGKFAGRTRDDSVVQVLFEQGEITEEEMGKHPDQSRLLQSLGGNEAPTPRLGSAPWKDGDAAILCSDGFWEHLTNPELEHLVSGKPSTRATALAAAVEKAVRRAGKKADNTTAILISNGGGSGGATHGQFPLFFWLLVLLTCAVWLWVWQGEKIRSHLPPRIQSWFHQPSDAPDRSEVRSEVHEQVKHPVQHEEPAQPKVPYQPSMLDRPHLPDQPEELDVPEEQGQQQAPDQPEAPQSTDDPAVSPSVPAAVPAVEPASRENPKPVNGPEKPPAPQEDPP
jgi:serine/threonine protein phosphatase PrpC